MLSLKKKSFIKENIKKGNGPSLSPCGTPDNEIRSTTLVWNKKKSYCWKFLQNSYVYYDIHVSNIDFL